MEQKVQAQQPFIQPQKQQKEQKQQTEQNKLEVSSENKVKESFQIDKGEHFKTSIQVFSIFQWKREQGQITNQHVKIGSQLVLISEINKVKCLKEEFFQKYRKLKICYKNNGKEHELFFLAGTKIKHSKFCKHFLWFSKIIDHKLLAMPAIKSNIPQQHHQEVQDTHKQFIVKGFIFKCSQHLKKWQQRFVLINKQALFSFKSSKQPYSFKIQAGSVKQIWTRFDLEKGHLIIKLRHGLNKTEFAVPIQNFSFTNEKNWIYGFYNLMIDI